MSYILLAWTWFKSTKPITKITIILGVIMVVTSIFFFGYYQYSQWSLLRMKEANKAKIESLKRQRANEISGEIVLIDNEIETLEKANKEIDAELRVIKGETIEIQGQGKELEKDLKTLDNTNLNKGNGSDLDKMAEDYANRNTKSK